MKKISIKDLEIKINSIEILNSLSLKKSLEIDFDGKIYLDEKNLIINPIIFKAQDELEISKVKNSDEVLKSIFKNYSPIIKNGELNLKIVTAWQEIILYNKDKMLYFDHQTDGVEFFEDKILEDIGWNCVPCDITYREISEFIESNCNGTLVYYDNGVQFNGFVIVDDINDVRQKVKSYVVEKIENMIKSDLLDIDDEEVLESLEFFNIKV